MRDARRGLGVVLLAATLLAAGGCILRPEDPDARRRAFDRSGLEGVLVDRSPTPLRQVGADLGDGIRLVGWRMRPATVGPGQRAEVDLVWEAREGPLQDWTVFVHLDPRGDLGSRLNRDHAPADGRYPTDVWQAGDLVVDTFSFTLPPEHPAKAFELWTGMFQGPTRLEVERRGRARSDGEDRLLVGTVRTR